MKLKLSLIIAFILLAALSRLIPHPPNVAPIAAMALFAGCYLTDKRLAWLLPMLALLLSDLILGFHGTMIYVYSAMAIIVAIGFLLQNHVKPINLVLASLSGSIIFYLITNFGVWLHYDFYSKDMAGLMASYIAGIPFLHYTLLGDLFFTGVMFGSFYWVDKKYGVLEQ